MIVDTRTTEVSFPENFEVCIVGAGAAGIPLALELAKKKIGRIALLEAGGIKYNKIAQDMYRGTVIGDRHPSLNRTRFAGLGGSTELWAGWCRPLDPNDFRKRAWIENSGWPFGIEEVNPFFERANEWCGLGPMGYELNEWEDFFEGESLADGCLLQDRLFRVKRINFRQAYSDQLYKSVDISVFLYATTLRFISDNSDAHVSSAFVELGDGRRSYLLAKQFVLATGGLENPRLLLLSGDSPAQSIGNEKGLVGKYFTEHGFVDSGWFRAAHDRRRYRRYFPIDHPVSRKYGSARHVLTLSPDSFERERLNNAILYFYPSYEASSVFEQDSIKAALELWEIAKKQAVPGDWGSLLGALAKRPHHIAWAAFRKLFYENTATRDWRMRCYFECIPDANNRLELGDKLDRFGRPLGKLFWRLGSEDLTRIQRFHELIGEALSRSGQGAMSFLRTENAWREKTESGKHPMGTTRMHASSSKGVVDENCLVYGTKNLFVAGSSIFPATGYANPTLTIIALTLRLADYLERT